MVVGTTTSVKQSVKDKTNEPGGAGALHQHHSELEGQGEDQEESKAEASTPSEQIGSSHHDDKSGKHAAGEHVSHESCKNCGSLADKCSCKRCECQVCSSKTEEGKPPAIEPPIKSATSATVLCGVSVHEVWLPDLRSKSICFAADALLRWQRGQEACNRRELSCVRLSCWQLSLYRLRMPRVQVRMRTEDNERRVEYYSIK
ncbi:hypothetical protein PF007_g13019 [Phytophthora fragariae]|uniref:Uncharacterized protein n=1 Tax=Phytophthora fragariae TaxID=53985 RepID=A0A6A3S2B7_9STRA|nr:hypothetical protein PF007_g13019 [Phytophthora fragariae]